MAGWNSICRRRWSHDRGIGCISEGDEDDGATAVCRPRTEQVVNRIVSAELIFVLAQLALQDSAVLGLPMHRYAIGATVMRNATSGRTHTVAARFRAPYLNAFIPRPNRFHSNSSGGCICPQTGLMMIASR
jgi:hypothetical protein